MGAQDRFLRRLNKWVHRTPSIPALKHHFWWLLHNCVAHPLIGIYPSTTTVRFHDYTSRWLNLNFRIPNSDLPDIQGKRWKWVKHNIFHHILIGVLPLPIFFEWHDQGAEEMEVENWV